MNIDEACCPFAGRQLREMQASSFLHRVLYAILNDTKKWCDLLWTTVVSRLNIRLPFEFIGDCIKLVHSFGVFYQLEMMIDRVPIPMMLLMVMACLLISGCASTQYIPTQVGVVIQETRPPLELFLRPQQDWVIKGNPILFEVEFRNNSNHSIWIPRSPNILLYWVYANGQRDNIVRDFPAVSSFSSGNAIELPPGKKMIIHRKIDTYYFPKCGITEFQAIYMATPNNNPHLTPFWENETVSNAYGIRVVNPGDNPLGERHHS